MQSHNSYHREISVDGSGNVERAVFGNSSDIVRHTYTGYVRRSYSSSSSSTQTGEDKTRRVCNYCLKKGTTHQRERIKQTTPSNKS